ncbi:MAG: effector-associated domain EAD1-containing protein [Bryobacteraceae bacterium]
MGPSHQLTLEQLNLLRTAFVTAYGSFAEIRTLVRFKLGDRLTTILEGHSLDRGAVEVIYWAEHQGRLHELVNTLLDDRPDHPDVIRLRDSLGIVGPRRTVPEYLAYLCDWSDPIDAIRTVIPTPGQPRTPAGIVAIATEDDCAEAFLRRIRKDLERVSKLSVREVIPIDWPETVAEAERLGGRIHRVLNADETAPIWKKLPAGLTILGTNVHADGWSAGNTAILERFLRYWRNWPPWSGSRALLLQVSIIVGGEEAKRKALEPIRGCLAEHCGEAVKAVAVSLPKVSSQHAITWLYHPDVRAHYRADRTQDLANELRARIPGTTEVTMRGMAAILHNTLALHG